MPPRGGFIPIWGGCFPLKAVVLSPQSGGFIPQMGWFYPPNGVVLSHHWVMGGGAITPLGWFYPWLIPPLGGGGGGVVTHLGAEGYGPSLCQPRTTVPEDKLPSVYMLCCKENTLGDGGGGLPHFHFGTAYIELTDLTKIPSL